MRRQGRLMLGLVLVCSVVSGCGGDQDSSSDTDSSTMDRQSTESSSPRVDGSSGSAREAKLSILRVYTREAGFQVFVDDRPVLSDSGSVLTTPCAVSLPHGDRRVRVVREGFRDAIQTLAIPTVEQVTFEPIADANPKELATIRLGEYWDLPVAHAAPLDAVNSSGAELDPFLTADGLTVWFAAERTEGRGVYLSSRPSPFHAFGPPEFIAASRNREIPATPSITSDGRLLVYSIPTEARIWSLRRENPLGEFGGKELLRFSEDADSAWLSVQILSDSSRLYWAESKSGQLTTRAAVRRGDGGEFGKSLNFPLPGTHPCVSHDGLRQYQFDGRVLRRSVRANLTSSFAESEIVMSLDLPGYSASSTRRQFWVSEDEQWMVYCRNPETDPDLYIVRLSEVPRRGLALLGRSIPQREFVDVTDDPAMPITNSEPEPASVEPVTTTPLQPEDRNPPQEVFGSYAEFRRQFLDAIGSRDFPTASALAERARNEPQLADYRELLVWDSEDVKNCNDVWSQFQNSLNMMDSGTPIRLGPLKLSLVSFDGNIIRAERGGKEVQRPIQELEAGDVVNIASLVLDRDDQAMQAKLGTFLYYDPTANRRLADSRLQRGGVEGKSFINRQAMRLVRQAELFLESGDLVEALDHIKRVEQDFDRTQAAEQVEALRASLYRYVKWDVRGSRQWDNDETTGEYRAGRTRSNGSLLVSPMPLESFELRCEWKIQGRASQGGVFFRYPGTERPYENSLKIQFANDANVEPDQFSTGAIFKLEAPSENAAKPEGEWNEFTLRVEREKIRVTLNGKLIHDTEIADSDFPFQGYIALDGEAGGISYRRILLLPIESR